MMENETDFPSPDGQSVKLCLIEFWGKGEKTGWVCRLEAIGRMPKIDRPDARYAICILCTTMPRVGALERGPSMVSKGASKRRAAAT